LKLNILRGIAIFLTQLTIVFYKAGSLDLLFGFNQTNAGLAALLLLLVLVPLFNLSWLIIEIKLFFKQFKLQKKLSAILMPFFALLLLVESIAIDLYILSQARM
jgi:hypothetical protein